MNFDAQIEEWKKLQANYKSWRTIGLIAVVITVIGWLILLHKISQTSMFALQFSDQVTETLGEWEMTLTIMTLITGILVVVGLRAKSRAATAGDTLRANMRNSLGHAAPGERAKIESQLRELGA